MTLEQPDVIDITHVRPDGRVLLILTDAGCTPDPAERFAAHAAKLSNYIRFACSPQFSEQFPGKTWRDVSIIALCKNAPTPDMLNIVRIGSSTIDPEVDIPVEFRIFDPDNEPQSPPSQPAVPVSPSTMSLQTPLAEAHGVEVTRITPADRKLMEGVMTCDLTAVRAALAEGGDPTKKHSGDLTALITATITGDTAILTTLLDAAPRITPSQVRALWVLAKATSNSTNAHALEKWGARPTLTDHLRWRLQKRQLKQSNGSR